MNGPLLLASNHPNSFLDAMLLDILFKKPIWSLARGDAFKKPFYTRLLSKLRILPVFRTSEGMENLETNYETFDVCKRIFTDNGIVLMFSEGKCVNEWHLRPLKKGTARLAISSWQEGLDLKVLPVGINYSSFRRFGKNVFLNFGNIISKENIDMNDTDGKRNLAFNALLQSELEKLVFEIPKSDRPAQQKKLTWEPSIAFRYLLFMPALLGLIIHAPFYVPVRYFASNCIKEPGHFDSLITGLLVLLYPFYLLLLIFVLLLLVCSPFVWLGLIIFPLLARAYVEVKGQLDKSS